MKEKILKKNTELNNCLERDNGSIFEVVFLAKNQNGTPNHAIVKVSPIFRSIPNYLKSGRIFIDMSFHQVTDHFHILQCYKCQGFGHKSNSKFCPMAKSKDSICVYCSSKHKSNACSCKNNTNEYYCYNSKKSKSNDIKNQAKEHTSTSWQCSVLQKELNHIKELTDTCPKNFPPHQSHSLFSVLIVVPSIQKCHRF